MSLLARFGGNLQIYIEYSVLCTNSVNSIELFDYNNYDPDVIFANVPERGVTLGSYVASELTEKSINYFPDEIDLINANGNLLQWDRSSFARCAMN